MESLPKELFKTDMSPNGHQRSREHFFTFGTPEKPANCSTASVIHGPLLLQHNGGIGHQIVDADGNTIAWTTDVLVAQVICGLMNDFTNNEEKGV